MPSTWTLPPDSDPSPDLLAAVAGHPLVARILANRGLDTVDKALPFLDPACYSPAPPGALRGVDRAAELIYKATQQECNILVWGDFDVDGQTSTALLVLALQILAGQDRVRFHIPKRIEEGHGIQPDALARRLDDPSWPPHLLLTCDTGIDQAAAVALAKAAGMTVVITDHHDLPEAFAGYGLGKADPWGRSADQVGAESVLRADAIVNPKLQPADDPLRTLPGVGVAYKLIQQIFRLAGISGQETDYLDLVALGIVADVAEQVHDTRYLLQRGLAHLRTTQRVGLQALMEVAAVDANRADAAAIGFQLGPRLNAVGRLGDATVAVELLTTTDRERARELAATMERLNQQRRRLTADMAATARAMIDRDSRLLKFTGLVLAHPAWHPGIVGIVASQLAAQYNRPTVLLVTPPGEPARGSARSIPGVDIGTALAECGRLLLGTGGHPGAAGLRLLPENIDEFRRELHRRLAVQLDHSHIDVGPSVLQIDAEIPIALVDMALAEELQRIAPFGNGNPEPLLPARPCR